MMLLTKEATDKDRSLKTQLLVSTSNSSDEKISSKRVWKSNGFFKDVRPEGSPEILQNIFDQSIAGVMYLATIKRLMEKTASFSFFRLYDDETIHVCDKHLKEILLSKNLQIVSTQTCF